MVATFAKHAEVWNKINAGAPLDSGVETRLGILLCNLLMTDYENRYHQYLAGYFDQRSWDSRVTILRTLVTLPIYEPWRNSLGGQSRGADFLDFVDELAKAGRADS